jgi:RimJ/RimL family protein N-acetyltransferase
MGASNSEKLSEQVRLREVIPEDLGIFFENQLDPDANRMAAFTSQDPTDREAFDRHWNRILGDSEIIIRTVLYKGEVAGSVLSYVQGGEREVSYWLGREFWGKGIATEALRQYLEYVQERPLYARAAKDNLGSLRVLEKCGFRISSEDRGFANARGEEIEENILILSS